MSMLKKGRRIHGAGTTPSSPLFLWEKGLGVRVGRRERRFAPKAAKGGGQERQRRQRRARLDNVHDLCGHSPSAICHPPCSSIPRSLPSPGSEGRGRAARGCFSPKVASLLQFFGIPPAWAFEKSAKEGTILLDASTYCCSTAGQMSKQRLKLAQCQQLKLGRDTLTRLQWRTPRPSSWACPTVLGSQSWNFSALSGYCKGMMWNSTP